jgi:hypothetical protein
MLTSCHTRAGSMASFFVIIADRGATRTSKSGPWGRAKGRRRTLLASHIFSRGVNHFYVSRPRVVAFGVRLILISAEQNRFSVLYQRQPHLSLSLSPVCFSRRPQNAREVYKYIYIHTALTHTARTPKYSISRRRSLSRVCVENRTRWNSNHRLGDESPDTLG